MAKWRIPRKRKKFWKKIGIIWLNPDIYIVQTSKPIDIEKFYEECNGYYKTTLKELND